MACIVGDFVESHDVITVTDDIETTHILIHVFHEWWQDLTLIIQYAVNLLSVVII